ncbi:MAG: HIT family protein [Mariprofundaceae bacterium]
MLDPQLKNDSHFLGSTGTSTLLLSKNALYPWFILVPHTQKNELHELDMRTQIALLSEVNMLSAFVKAYFSADKINVATLGNIVKQLHIHIIGRNTTDACWPGVVWGTQEKKSYSGNQLQQLTDNLRKEFANSYSIPE